MKIIYSNVIHQHAGWGAEWFMNKAFQSIGCDTYCIDYRQDRKCLIGSFEKAPPADIFFLQRGDHFPLCLMRAMRVPSFFWVSELISRCNDFHHLLSENHFEHVFVRTPTCKEEIVRRKWAEGNRVSILLSAFDPQMHHPMPDVPKDIDVLFVGSLTRRREQWLDVIKKRLPLSIRSAFGKDMVHLACRAKIVINIHGEDYRDTETRIFEMLGSASFIITERLSSENPFTSEHLIECDTCEQMVDLIFYYLKNEEARAKIAQAGHQEALTKHTYVNRALQVSQEMKKILQSQSTSLPISPVTDSWKLRSYKIWELFGLPAPFRL